MMSRSLKPTWPFSSRWIFHSEARMASPACSRDSPASIRSRRSCVPTSIRWTVGPPGAVLPSVIGSTFPETELPHSLLPRRSCPGSRSGSVDWTPWRAGRRSRRPRPGGRAGPAFDAHKPKLLATLRRDGSHRISGIEATFADGELWLGMMPGSRKALDLRRDPRLALHSASLDPPEDPTTWPGDAKLAGRAVEVDAPALKERFAGGGGQPDEPHLFRVDIPEVGGG